MARKRLNSLEKAELVALVKDMMELFDDNKLFVRSVLAGSEDIEVERYKKKISRALSYDMQKSEYWNLEEAERTLRYLEKATDNPRIIADVYVHAVVKGHKITDEMGDIDGDYYDSMIEIYEDAIKWAIVAEKQGHNISRLKDELHQVMLKAKNVGWGYGDEISEIWTEYFGDIDAE